MSGIPTAIMIDLYERAAQNGQLRHYSATSTCRVSTVKGMPDSARTSIHSSIASRMFTRASSFVSPWLTHPGMEGHSATQTPSSSRSIVTVIFIARPPVGRASPLTKVLLGDALPTLCGCPQSSDPASIETNAPGTAVGGLSPGSLASHVTPMRVHCQNGRRTLQSCPR